MKWIMEELKKSDKYNKEEKAELKQWLDEKGLKLNKKNRNAKWKELKEKMRPKDEKKEVVKAIEIENDLEIGLGQEIFEYVKELL